MKDELETFRTLVEGFRGRAAKEAENDMGAALGQRLDASLSLAEAGEPLIALEALCENLYDYDVRLDTAEHESLVKLLKAWGLERSSSSSTLASLKP